MNLKLQCDNTTPKGNRHRVWTHGQRGRRGLELRLIESEGPRYWSASCSGIAYSDDEPDRRWTCVQSLREHAARLENLARTIEVIEERLDAGKQPWKLIKVDEVTWDKLEPDVRMARFLYAEISDFKASCLGQPVEYETHEAYLADLDKICASFRFAGWSEDYTHERPAGYQEGLDLFAKLFGSFWH